LEAGAGAAGEDAGAVSVVGDAGSLVLLVLTTQPAVEMPPTTSPNIRDVFFMSTLRDECR
jgi:hypothetical protein